MPPLAVISTASAIICSLAGLLNYLLTLRLRAEIAELRTQIADERRKDREELRDWINGSFLRAGEAHARMEGLEHRVAMVERRAAA